MLLHFFLSLAALTNLPTLIASIPAHLLISFPWGCFLIFVVAYSKIDCVSFSIVYGMDLVMWASALDCEFPQCAVQTGRGRVCSGTMFS